MENQGKRIERQRTSDENQGNPIKIFDDAMKNKEQDGKKHMKKTKKMKENKWKNMRKERRKCVAGQIADEVPEGSGADCS